MSDGAKMLRGRGGWFHWCPGCLLMHCMPHDWKFNGDVDHPTFEGSFKHRFVRHGGESTCHYTVTAGIIVFGADCSHALASEKMAMQDIPDHAAEALGL